VEIVFKNGTDINVPEVGISITDYQGSYDTQLLSSGSLSNYGGGGLMTVNSGSAFSLIRFDISALEGKFSSINSVKLRLYPRNGSSAGSTIAYRLSDLNSNWIEGDHYTSITCCPGNASGANWTSSVGNRGLGPQGLWASGFDAAVRPYVDYDAGPFDGGLGALPGLGDTDNSTSVLNAIDGTGTPIGTPAPFDIDLGPQAVSGGGVVGGTTASLTDLVTDWASADSSEWFHRTGFEPGWHSTHMPWLDSCANKGFEDGCTPVVANEGLLLRGTSPTSMQFWTGDGSNWGAVHDPFGVGGTTPVVYRPELVIDFEVATACIIGDANCDGYVDIGADILTAFTNFTGPGSFGKTRVQGDVHGPATATAFNDPHDGDVDVSDILTMFGAFTGPPPDEAGLGAPAEAGDPAIPDLIYDATTGEVVFDLDGAAGLIGYSLKSAGGFLAGGHTPILGGVTTSLSTELAEAALSTPGLPASIGFVFPLGMDLAALMAFLTDNTVSTGLGAPLVPFDLVVVGGTVVPEPATVAMALFGLVGLGLAAYRRRRPH